MAELPKRIHFDSSLDVVIDILQVKKKNRCTAMFWKEVGVNVGHSGEEVERLMKNLQGDFQKVKQHLHLSGAGTSSPPHLRNSSKLFQLFDTYYQLFYPQGGSALPSFVMTEMSMQLTST